jgi:hypothetical protein
VTDKLRAGEHMHGVPVIVATERGDETWCYACFQDEDSEKRTLLQWYADDAENYPAECEVCGVTLYHKDQSLPVEAP